MEKHEQTRPEPEEPGRGQVLLNIAKWIFLIAALTGAWFLLDRLINGK